MQLIAAQTFNRQDRFSGGSGETGHARAGCLIVHQHCAGATSALTASELGSGQIQLVAQHRQQAILGLAFDLMRLPIDAERVDGHARSLPARHLELLCQCSTIGPPACGSVRGDMRAAGYAGANGRVSAAVRVDGELRSIPSEFPPRAIFPIYSIAKTLTAICVLRLVEDGLLRLADPARRWLPEVSFPTAITLTHLLRHTSGLRDYGPLPEYHEAVRARANQPWTRQQFLDSVLTPGMLFAPGESFSYSNVGYMLLIDTVERVTGRTFAEVIDEFVTKPLDLQNTFVLEEIDDLMQCVPGFGSEVTFDGQLVDVRGRYHPGWCAPRLIASTAEDVTCVFDTLIAGDLLEAETLAQMLTFSPLTDQPDEIHSGGMGVYSDLSSIRGRNYHHGGGGPGYNLCATVYPDTPLGRISIAVFVNSSCGPQANDCEATLLAQLLDEP